MSHPWRIALFAPPDALGSAASLTSAVWGDPPEGARANLSVALGGPSGALFAGCTAASDEEAAAFAAGASAVEGLAWFRWSAASDALAAASVPEAAPGTAWGWKACLDTLGASEAPNEE